jgi:hypothetical protein
MYSVIIIYISDKLHDKSSCNRYAITNIYTVLHYQIRVSLFNYLKKIASFLK